MPNPFAFLRPDPLTEPAYALYAALVRQARKPEFYALHGVPDTLDGRFDMILLHVAALLSRLKQESAPPAARLARSISEAFVTDMDRNLREMGIGDTGIKRRVGNMAQAFYGRLHAYEEALAQNTLPEAIARNLYRQEPPAVDATALQAMTGYYTSLTASLGKQSLEAICRGDIRFP